MHDLVIRTERPGDGPAIRALHDAAFGGPVESGIVDAIRGTDRWIDGGSLVAEAAGGGMVGHLLLSRGDVRTPDGSVVPVWMVGPVAVAPARQGRGLGTAMMHAAISLADERREPVLLLLGHPDYYRRFGFVPARSVGIEPPNPSWPNDAWLALRLSAWSPEVVGVAAYPPAFPVD